MAKVKNDVIANKSLKAAAPKKVVLRDGLFRGIPEAMDTLADLTAYIMNAKYMGCEAEDAGRVEARAFLYEGSIGIALFPAGTVFDEMDEYEPFQVYDDTDFFKAISGFFTDLTEFSVDADVELSLDHAEFWAASQMDLFKMLSSYIGSEEFALLTPDTIFACESDLDPEIKTQQRAHRERLHSQYTKAAYEQAPENKQMVLAAVNNTPYTSMRAYEAACYLCSRSEYSIPLGHIFDMIRHEEGIDIDEHVPNVYTGQKITYGGYH